MYSELKGRLIAFISSWVYFVFAVIIYLSTKPQSNTRINYMVILSVASLTWAMLLYRRGRLIEDTAETLLNTGAQGYVEVTGTVSLYDGESLRGVSEELPPMVWYRHGLLTDSAGFILEDSKGRCTIDPRDAEIITPLYSYNTKYYRSIYPHESIYVLGQLETLKKHQTEYERNSSVSSKIWALKKDKDVFMDYFDTNNDGVIDDAEMEIAKNAAMRLVDEDIEIEYQKPPTHVISVPEDGRPFIVSSIHPDKLVSKYKLMMIVHLFTWVYLSLLVLLR